MSSTTELRRTPLYERHADLGAKLVPFAGWEMPVQYAGIREEHLAVRTDAGVFDVSHMGQVETRGPQALEFLQRVLSNDLRRMPEGGAQYSVLCNEDGGVLDDLFTYRLADCDVPDRHQRRQPREGPRVAAGARRGVRRRRDRPAADFAMLAVQGPKARATRARAGRRQPAVALPRAASAPWPVSPMLVCGTGYTGEDGVELLLDARRTRRRSGTRCSTAGAAPVGLGARDTLRLEVCFHLYGNDLERGARPDRGGPRLVLQGGNGLHRLRGGRRSASAGDRREKLVPFVIEGQGIARQGNPVIGGGEVTSGTFSPCLERGIGMAYVSSGRAPSPGRSFEIDVRGRTRPAVVERKPLYRKGA